MIFPYFRKLDWGGYRLNKTSHSFLCIQIQEWNRYRVPPPKLLGQVCFRIWNFQFQRDTTYYVESGTNSNSSAVKPTHYLLSGIKIIKSLSHLFRSGFAAQWDQVRYYHQVIPKQTNKLFPEYFGFWNLDMELEAYNTNYLLQIRNSG